MKRTFAAILALAAAGAMATTGSATSTKRSGALHATKECGDYHGAAGEFCTITSSNIPAIKKGMRVVYASAADFNALTLDSNLVIDGPGNNDVFGHVVLDISTFTGVVTLSGGTGRFSHFHAGPLAVACPAFPEVCSWDGAYDFTPPGDD
jgi:hypothetical protein